MKGCVTSQRRDKDGNLVGLANANPILDTHEYRFTFDDGDETVLNANLIAEAMSSETVLCPILWGINLPHIYAREVR